VTSHLEEEKTGWCPAENPTENLWLLIALNVEFQNNTDKASKYLIFQYTLPASCSPECRFGISLFFN
jgi:hypothetical protein